MDNLHWAGRSWWHQCVRLHNGSILQQLWFYLSATRCFSGVYWHPCPNSILVGHTNKTLMTYRPVSDSSTGCFLAVVPCMHGAHYEHDSLIFHQFSITKLFLLVCGCMCTGTLGYMPRHTDQTSLNKIITCYWDLTSDMLVRTVTQYITLHQT